MSNPQNPTPPLSPEELSEIEAELIVRLSKAKEIYETAQAEAIRIQALGANGRLKHSDARTAALNAVRAEREALERYADILASINGCVLDRNRAEDLPRVAVIYHPPSTVEFSCFCGQNLTFGSGAQNSKPLQGLPEEGETKRVRCPKCRLIHCSRSGRDLVYPSTIETGD
jgi:hypothetical protein